MLWHGHPLWIWELHMSIVYQNEQQFISDSWNKRRISEFLFAPKKYLSFSFSITLSKDALDCIFETLLQWRSIGISDLKGFWDSDNWLNINCLRCYDISFRSGIPRESYVSELQEVSNRPWEHVYCLTASEWKPFKSN